MYLIPLLEAVIPSSRETTQWKKQMYPRGAEATGAASKLALFGMDLWQYHRRRELVALAIAAFQVYKKIRNSRKQKR